jgi:S1/P1 nuclease
MIGRLIGYASLFLMLATGSAFAWGHEGHEVVGSIADQLLANHAKQEVAQILGFELRVAGPWADCVRGVVREADGTFVYAPDPHHPEYRIPCTSFETAAETARMEDYAKRNWTNCTYLPGRGCHETYHFDDVAFQHDHYDRAYAGTNNHDVVSVINAAILVLRDKPAPAPFSIKDKKEALFLLAHFVGDLHQPLHVGAVYLDPAGAPVNPDSGSGLDPNSETAGGNKISDGHTNFHAEWDAIPAALGRSADPAMVQLARGVTPASGPIEGWAAAWAGDTVIASHSAFAGVAFGPDVPGHWLIHFTDREQYVKDANKLKREQIAKAGARLAQLLNTIWP